MLRFIQPSGNEVSMDLLLQSTGTQAFLNKLKGAQSGPAAVLSWMVWSPYGGGSSEFSNGLKWLTMNYSNSINNSTDTDFVHVLSPQMLEGCYLWTRPGDSNTNAEDDGRLFLTSSGRPIESATNNLIGLHAQ